MKPVGIIAFLAGVVGLLAHYVTVGPMVPDDESEAPSGPPASGEGGE
jgi:hypothetical protein